MVVVISMPMIVTVTMPMPMPPKNNPFPKLLHFEILACAGMLEYRPHPLLREPVMLYGVCGGQRVGHLLVRQEIKNDENPARFQSLDETLRGQLRVLKVMEPEPDAGDIEAAEARGVGEGRWVRVGRIREVSLVGVHFFGAQALSPPEKDQSQSAELF